jgi:hypothetical protein
MLFVSVAAPLLAAAAQAQPIADAAHDEAVARALGYAWSGAFRALDVPIASALLFLPFGTRALRAALASAAVSGAAGGLLFLLARRLLEGCTQAPRIRAIVAALASACATLGGAWLLESSCAGSSVVGVVLVLAPLVWITRDSRPERWPLLFLMLGLAVSYEPLVGVIASVGSLAAVASSGFAIPRRGSRKSLVAWCVSAFACGFLPFALALAWKRCALISLDVGVWHAPLGEGATAAPSRIAPLLHDELGWVLLALGALGAARSLAVRASRSAGACVVAMLLASALAVALGASSENGRFGAPVLTLIGAVAVLASVPMQWAVVAVARSKVPLASASAAMILLLELTFPVLTLDDALARQDARTHGAARAWDDAAFEALPSGSLFLVEDRGLYARAVASRATGELRGDLSLVPLFDIAGPSAARELARDVRLYPLWRDLALTGAPREWSLSEVAGGRPIALAFEPHWERPLLRHVVPRGLLTTFEPEPRGASERLRALDVAAAEQAQLEEVVGDGKDARLAALAARLLYDRAALLTSLGEHDAAEQALGSARALEPLSATNERIAHRGAPPHPSRLMPTLP